MKALLFSLGEYIYIYIYIYYLAKLTPLQKYSTEKKIWIRNQICDPETISCDLNCNMGGPRINLSDTPI
jgi:hypothetical protein